MTPTQLRSAIIEVRDEAVVDLARVFRQVSTAAQAREALEDLLPALIEEYGAAVAAMAAEWYDAAREKAGAARAFTAIPAEVGDRGVSQLIGWGLAPAFVLGESSPAEGLASSLTRITGGMERRISDVGRDTISGSAIADPSARGWQRYASGGCPFCVMVAARGGVFTRATADFASHDNCKCVAVPAFRGEPVPVKPYVPTTRNITDADRARVRAYLRANPAG